MTQRIDKDKIIENIDWFYCPWNIYSKILDENFFNNCSIKLTNNGMICLCLNWDSSKVEYKNSVCIMCTGSTSNERSVDLYFEKCAQEDVKPAFSAGIYSDNPELIDIFEFSHISKHNRGCNIYFSQRGDFDFVEDLTESISKVSVIKKVIT